MSDKYIMPDDSCVPVPCDDLLEWARSMEKRRHVGDDGPTPGVRVSTVFLGIDHSFGDDGPPVLFETMIFGGPHNEEQWRYCTWDEAERGHKAAVALAGGGKAP